MRIDLATEHRQYKKKCCAFSRRELPEKVVRRGLLLVEFTSIVAAALQ